MIDTIDTLSHKIIDPQPEELKNQYKQGKEKSCNKWSDK